VNIDALERCSLWRLQRFQNAGNHRRPQRIWALAFQTLERAWRHAARLELKRHGALAKRANRPMSGVWHCASPFPSAQDVFSLERASFPSLSGSVQTPGENQLQLALSEWNAKKPAR